MNKNYLKKFMESIPNRDYKATKDGIIKKCHITDYVWSNWLSGRTNIPELAKPVINEIAGFDIFSKPIPFDKDIKFTHSSNQTLT